MNELIRGIWATAEQKFSAEESRLQGELQNVRTLRDNFRRQLSLAGNPSASHRKPGQYPLIRVKAAIYARQNGVIRPGKDAGKLKVRPKSLYNAIYGSEWFERRNGGFCLTETGRRELSSYAPA